MESMIDRIPVMKIVFGGHVPYESRKDVGSPIIDNFEWEPNFLTWVLLMLRAPLLPSSSLD